jgi:hypothetical protein
VAAKLFRFRLRNCLDSRESDNTVHVAIRKFDAQFGRRWKCQIVYSHAHSFERCHNLTTISAELGIHQKEMISGQLRTRCTKLS